jgi:predicted nucleotidyltransferase
MIDVTFHDAKSGLSQTLELARAQKASRLRLFSFVVRGEPGPKSDANPLVDFETVASTLACVGLVGGLNDKTTEEAYHAQ